MNSGCGFESSCSHLNYRYRACFEHGFPWHSGNYRVWIHSETLTWRDKNIQFKGLFLKSLTERLTKKINKEVLLLGDFNIDPIKSNSIVNASEFLDVIYSSNLLPHTTSPTWLTSRSHTLIENIFSDINEECTSGNTINTISDHFGQFLISKNNILFGIIYYFKSLLLLKLQKRNLSKEL